MTPTRSRLPNRRPAHTETLTVDGQVFEATVGIDPESGQPRGHTSLTGAVDAQIAVKRSSAGSIIVTIEWMKDGARADGPGSLDGQARERCACIDHRCPC